MKLKNQEIWLAYPNIRKLADMKLPVGVSLQLAHALIKLEQPYIAIERERSKLVNLYGEKQADGTMQVAVDGEKGGEFARDFGELLVTEWDEDFEFEKVKLPADFQVEPNILKPLLEHFIDV